MSSASPQASPQSGENTFDSNPSTRETLLKDKNISRHLEMLSPSSLFSCLQETLHRFSSTQGFPVSCLVNLLIAGAPQPWNAPYGAPQPAEEERPPPGCERDAIKLFLSGLPKTWDLPDVKNALEEFGSVNHCSASHFHSQFLSHCASPEHYKGLLFVPMYCDHDF